MFGAEITHQFSENRFLGNTSFGKEGVSVPDPGLTLSLKACMVLFPLYEEHISLKSKVCDSFGLGSELCRRWLEQEMGYQAQYLLYSMRSGNDGWGGRRGAHHGSKIGLLLVCGVESQGVFLDASTHRFEFGEIQGLRRRYSRRWHRGVWGLRTV